jgi:hypothetical protein
MSENKLSDVLGVDQSAEDSLSRAGVHTPQELAKADAESLAMASGIPIDRIRDWQQRARRAGSGGAKRSPVATGWMVAIFGLLIAVLLGWITMTIGSRRIKQAEQIKVVAESRLDIALRFAAGKTMDDLRQARLALHNKNWGSAQAALSEVRECVAFMADVAPEGKREEVTKLRDSVEQLQRAAEEQSEGAMDGIDALEAALDRLARPQ